MPQFPTLPAMVGAVAALDSHNLAAQLVDGSTAILTENNETVSALVPSCKDGGGLSCTFVVSVPAASSLQRTSTLQAQVVSVTGPRASLHVAADEATVVATIDLPGVAPAGVPDFLAAVADDFALVGFADGPLLLLGGCSSATETKTHPPGGVKPPTAASGAARHSGFRVASRGKLPPRAAVIGVAVSPVTTTEVASATAASSATDKSASSTRVANVILVYRADLAVQFIVITVSAAKGIVATSKPRTLNIAGAITDVTASARRAYLLTQNNEVHEVRLPTTAVGTRGKGLGDREGDGVRLIGGFEHSCDAICATSDTVLVAALRPREGAVAVTHVDLVAALNALDSDSQTPPPQRRLLEAGTRAMSMEFAVPRRAGRVRLCCHHASRTVFAAAGNTVLSIPAPSSTTTKLSDVAADNERTDCPTDIERCLFSSKPRSSSRLSDALVLAQNDIRAAAQRSSASAAAPTSSFLDQLGNAVDLQTISDASDTYAKLLLFWTQVFSATTPSLVASRYVACLPSVSYVTILSACNAVVASAAEAKPDKGAGTTTRALVDNLAAIISAASETGSFTDSPHSAARRAFSRVHVGVFIDCLYVIFIHALRVGDLPTTDLVATLADAVVVAHSPLDPAATQVLGAFAVLLAQVSRWTSSEPGIMIGQLTAHCGRPSDATKEARIVPQQAHAIVSANTYSVIASELQF